MFIKITPELFAFLKKHILFDIAVTKQASFSGSFKYLNYVTDIDLNEPIKSGNYIEKIRKLVNNVTKSKSVKFNSISFGFNQTILPPWNFNESTLDIDFNPETVKLWLQTVEIQSLLPQELINTLKKELFTTITYKRLLELHQKITKIAKYKWTILDIQKGFIEINNQKITLEDLYQQNFTFIIHYLINYNGNYIYIDHSLVDMRNEKNKQYNIIALIVKDIYSENWYNVLKFVLKTCNIQLKKHSDQYSSDQLEDLQLFITNVVNQLNSISHFNVAKKFLIMILKINKFNTLSDFEIFKLRKEFNTNKILKIHINESEFFNEQNDEKKINTLNDHLNQSALNLLNQTITQIPVPQIKSLFTDLITNISNNKSKNFMNPHDSKNKHSSLLSIKKKNSSNFYTISPSISKSKTKKKSKPSKKSTKSSKKSTPNKTKKSHKSSR